MKKTALILATALASPLAFAQGTPAQPDQAGQTSDSKGGDAEKLKGYGYGTPSGVESHGSAGQAVQKKLKKGHTPQEEQRTPKAQKKAGKARGAAHAPSPDVPGSNASSPTQPRSAGQQQGDPSR